MYYTAGRAIHSLPDGPSVWGVTSLDNEIYVMRWKKREQIEVYNANTYRFQCSLTVSDIRGFTDMTICEHYRCLYLSDHLVECVHRVELEGVDTLWPVNAKPSCLSVNSAHNVLVTCRVVRTIKEFSTRGELVRELRLPGDVVNPCHAIQLTNGQFIVCHGARDDAVKRVCGVSSDGRHVVQSSPGSDSDSPAHLAVDDNEFVFLADVNNRRVTLFSPALSYVRRVVSCDELRWRPRRLYLDVRRRRLYVGETEWKDGKFTAGCVEVFNV